jgi:thioredoxin reductase (NADPH)
VRATCDGFFFFRKKHRRRRRRDSAMEEANFLTKFADKVYVIHRRVSLRVQDDGGPFFENP